MSGAATAESGIAAETRALWEQAAASDDPVRIGGLYAADAWLQLPCATLQNERDGITDAWRELRARPNFSLDLAPSAVDVASGADMAVERGSAQFMHYVGGIPFATNADYVRVWRRIDGEWRIAADMFGQGSTCPDDTD